MISSLARYMHYWANYLPMKFIGIVLIIILIILIIVTFNINLNIKYKIHNKILNTLNIICYLLYYIILIIVFRIFAIGKEIHLQNLILWFSQILRRDVFIAIILLLLVILLTLILFKINHYLRKEVRKRFLYQAFYITYRDTQNSSYNISHFKLLGFSKLVYIFKHKYSFQSLLSKIIFDISCICSIFNYKVEIDYLHDKHFNIFIKILPHLILVILFIYDCFFNHLIITKVFYYLPFYVIYNLWYNISDFIHNTNNIMNRIIYERYYEEDNILYLTTEDVEDNFLNSYLKNHLQCLSKTYYYDKEKFFQTKNEIDYWCNSFISIRRFVRLQNEEFKYRYVYENETTGDRFEFSKERFFEIKNNKDD